MGADYCINHANGLANCSHCILIYWQRWAKPWLKHQLLVDRAITQESESNLSAACFYQQQSLQLHVPHIDTWVPGTVQGYTDNLHWELYQAVETNLEAKSKPLHKSPLSVGHTKGMHCPHCKGLNLLSQIVRKSGSGYRFSRGATISYPPIHWWHHD